MFQPTRCASSALLIMSAGVLCAADSPAILLPKGTLIPIEIMAPISSESAVDGDKFPIRVAEPVSLNGAIVIAAGISGQGEVIHAAPSQSRGMPGELIVAARFVSCGPTRIALGHLQFSASGRDKTMAWIVTRSILRYPGMVKGTSSEIPAGTRGLAKTTADTPIAALGACAQINAH